MQFDGTGAFSSSTISSDYVVIEPDVYQDQDSTWHTRWHDTGIISVAIPNPQTINGNAVTMEGLVAGQYSANIYFHIVTNL